MTGNAAKQITEMVESSIAKVEAIVSETQRTVATLIEQGNQKSNQE